jgi:hypothetical protein
MIHTFSYFNLYPCFIAGGEGQHRNYEHDLRASHPEGYGARATADIWPREPRRKYGNAQEIVPYFVKNQRRKKVWKDGDYDDIGYFGEGKRGFLFGLRMISAGLHILRHACTVQNPWIYTYIYDS